MFVVSHFVRWSSYLATQREPVTDVPVAVVVPGASKHQEDTCIQDIDIFARLSDTMNPFTTDRHLDMHVQTVWLWNQLQSLASSG